MFRDKPCCGRVTFRVVLSLFGNHSFNKLVKMVWPDLVIQRKSLAPAPVFQRLIGIRVLKENKDRNKLQQSKLKNDKNMLQRRSLVQYSDKLKKYLKTFFPDYEHDDMTSRVHKFTINFILYTLLYCTCI